MQINQTLKFQQNLLPLFLALKDEFAVLVANLFFSF